MCCCGWVFLSHHIPTCQYCPWLAGYLLLLQKPRSSPLGHGQPRACSRWTRSRGDGHIAGVSGAAAFWIATKDNLTYYSKLKSVVVSLRTPGCKLLWLMVSEAAESPSHPPSSWSVSPASKALGLTCLLPAPAGPQPALGLPHSSGEQWCLLGPFTLHYIPTFGYCWREGTEIGGLWSIWLFVSFCYLLFQIWLAIAVQECPKYFEKMRSAV